MAVGDAPKVPVTQASLGGAALAMAPQAAGMAASALSPASKQYRKDVDALRKGKLGLTASQKRGMLGAAMRGAEAQTKGIEAGLRREAAALGGTGRSGRQMQAIGQLGKQKAEAAVQSQAAIDQMSQQQALSEKARILGQMEARRRELKQDVGQLAQTGIAGAAYGAEKAKEEQKKLGQLSVPMMTEEQKAAYGRMTPEQKEVFDTELAEKARGRAAKAAKGAAGRSAVGGATAALGMGEQSSSGETVFGMIKADYDKLTEEEKKIVEDRYLEGR
tara:strand:+ start:3591 stop:4415 length:825 start_codon:yes stop_codon:yes gene_type:complete